MPESLEIDVDQLMERLRSNSDKYRSEKAPPPASAPLLENQRPAEFDFLENSYDIYHLDFTSHRKGIGRAVVFIKKILRQFLTPILERQLALNAANARVASYVWEQLAVLREQQVAMQAQQVAMQAQQVAMQAQQVAMQEQQQVAIQAQQAAMQEQQAVMQQQQAATLQALHGEIIALGETLHGLQHDSTQLRDNAARLDHLQQEHATRVESALSQRDKRLVEGEKAHAQLKTAQVLQERRLTMLLEEARRRLPEPFNHDQLHAIADEEKHVLEALYVSFEDQFRGTRHDIKERFRVYLPLLEEAKLGSAQMPILDVGCGRGEWLELLYDTGLRAQGVDQNRVLVEDCRRLGLEVLEAEAVSCLSGLPQESLGAVTGFHIIEHLPLEVLVKLLDETVRVLKPGGIAIFETPNPENVLVGSHNFYLDPTHRNPLPSGMMKFLAEARGLCRVTIMNLHPYPEFHHLEEAGLDIAKRFNKYFYGPQDYAVVGWKVS
jgi:SAM-dependent methyltransferase